ncbi:DUF4263 domain-containing protein [Clostridium estertheticum]|uniref:Shedu immune nuclease family protein n=1 Tax=Clostridium estertheticum TaxID=238834 RepID=UPI001C0E187A|nr:Shedu immune nuclease family protein [Clostridium estertheticum]MBU3216576.1 DUF4263 domain-containing protein [Clostridium estertheticum]WAG54512.1 DUF4263 domain-containing protein [Clostridium estertheticum]
MKISDFIFQYHTYSITGCDGICRVRTFHKNEAEFSVLLTDLGYKNTSASVTNSIKSICNSLIEKGMIPKASRFIEHYEADSFQESSFDLISFDSNGLHSWSQLKQKDVEELTGCNEEEFKMQTFKDRRLLNEIEKSRNKIDPYRDFPLREHHEVINRRIEIESKKISKKKVMDVIEEGSNEQDIGRVLKNDLSLFAEVYAQPDEEYICFSEFPVDQGYVDYVVFTGRSRMNIFLIEVKGADFYILNQNSYEQFSAKVEQAASQFRRRMTYINKNYETFKKKAHEIREKVESGQRIYNSLLGPKGYLSVDPKKEINIYGVLICGRTRDDLKESAKRHEYENSHNPSIKIETWETWLRKLRRM